MLERAWWRRRWRWALLGTLAALVVAAASWWWASAEPDSAANERVAVGWPADLSADDAANLLSDLGLTDDRTALALYFRMTGASRCFRAGAHLLPRGASPRVLRRLLCADPSRATVKITVPEGFTRFAIGERLEQSGVASRAAFLSASSDAELLRSLGVEPGPDAELDTAEGYLFPATYQLPVDEEPSEIVRRMVRELDRRFGRLRSAHREGYDALATELGFGRREVLTLASIVEKETASAEERPMIARVFLNRLADPSFEPRLLQSDPTAVYGCLVLGDVVDACRAAAGKPSPAINQDPANRYSTYVRPGLPPGPIANPGDAALAAVLAPADGDYFYFVARGDGRHSFSRTLEEHNRAVRLLRQRAARSTGSSAP